MLGLLIRAIIWFSLIMTGLLIQDTDPARHMEAYAIIMVLMGSWIVLYQMEMQRGLHGQRSLG